MQNKYFSMDISLYPVIIITISSHKPTNEEFEEYLDAMRFYYEQGEFIAFVFDSRKASYLSAELRIRQGTWIKENYAEIAKVQCGFSFVIPNMMVQFILNAILLVSPLPAPHKIFKDLNEGIVWALEQVKEKKELSLV